MNKFFRILKLPVLSLKDTYNKNFSLKKFIVGNSIIKKT